MLVWLNENAAAVTALATAATAIIAIAALVVATLDNRGRTRPMVVAEFVPAEHNTNAFDLVIRNYGQSLARDLEVTFDPPVIVPAGADAVVTHYLIARYAEVIPTLSPGQELKNIWWSGRDRGAGDLENSEPTPDKVTVSVTYGRGWLTRYRDTFPLDANTIKLTTFSTSSESLPGRLEKATKAIVSIDDSLKQTVRALNRQSARKPQVRSLAEIHRRLRR